jgi:hypothetical protein
MIMKHQMFKMSYKQSLVYQITGMKIQKQKRVIKKKNKKVLTGKNQQWRKIHLQQIKEKELLKIYNQ